MKRLFRSIQRGGEEGLTLPEVMVNLVVMGIVLTAFLAILATVQREMVRERDRTSTEDQARLAVEAVDREVRSGDVLYNPSFEPSPTVAGYGFRVYTEANAPTRNGGNPLCVQYRVSGGNLLRRSWPSGNTAAATAWRTVALNIVNTTAPFSLDSGYTQLTSSATGGRTLHVTLKVNAKPGNPQSKDVVIQESVAIRNIGTGDPCTPVPSG
jgi:type II secretory pathway component PulJ